MTKIFKDLKSALFWAIFIGSTIAKLPQGELQPRVFHSVAKYCSGSFLFIKGKNLKPHLEVLILM